MQVPTLGSWTLLCVLPQEEKIKWDSFLLFDLDILVKNRNVKKDRLFHVKKLLFETVSLHKCLLSTIWDRVNTGLSVW